MKTVINVKVADLKMHKSYTKIYSERNRQLELLVDSIKETKGVLYPIVINQKNEIINGVQRWLAYKQLNKSLIPATVIKETEPNEEVILMISYNRHKDKTMLERWHEIEIMKKAIGKRQGERTDLKADADSTSTRKKLSMHMGISEGNVFKIEKIANTQKELLGLIDAKEISLHEAYERALELIGKQTKPKKSIVSKSESQKPEEVEDCKCPKCGHSFIN